MNNPKFIDMHCDTLMMHYFIQNKDLLHNDFMVDLERMKKGGQLAQFFAVFMPFEGAAKAIMDIDGMDPIDDEKYIEYCLDIFHTSTNLHSDIILPAYSGADVKKNLAEGKMSALLSFEDGRAVKGDMERLCRYYDDGFRMIALTWNAANCFGSPCSADPAVMSQGLTDFGKEAVEEMNRLGMIVDVSHLSDGGFWDVARISKKPFVASHSNCRALAPHQRNLTDDMIRAIAEKGGVAGINYGGEFLTGDPECLDSRVEDMVRHIRHMADVGGIGCIGLGSDWDGIWGNLDIPDPSKEYVLFDALKKNGFSSTDIEKIASGNVLRVLDDVL